VSLASQPYCGMSPSTSYRSRRWHGSQTTPKSGPRVGHERDSSTLSGPLP
jgi:hypothetical protein